jgi:site-specific DNA-methyltransferase (adenine-specific)
MKHKMNDRCIVYSGDNRVVLKDFREGFFDAVVTDPPYGLTTSPGAKTGFMGQEWDVLPPTETWEAILRVAKPGAHLLAFGGTRRYHRLVCAIEDAGWEIKDCIFWVCGSGWPKGQELGKSIDKELGAAHDRKVVGRRTATNPGSGMFFHHYTDRGRDPEEAYTITAAATAAAKAWEGWGCALKPAVEPIVLARKPLSGTLAENVRKHGTGALNINACRVPVGTAGGDRPEQGRYPANLIMDGSQEVVDAFPNTASGTGLVKRASGSDRKGNRGAALGAESRPEGTPMVTYGDRGSASRIFYTAKASRAERGQGNGHCTVKPRALMRYLVRLVTQPGGWVLDPFMGSGTTGLACHDEKFRFAGVELSEEYADLAMHRLLKAQEGLE